MIDGVQLSSVVIHQCQIFFCFLCLPSHATHHNEISLQVVKVFQTKLFYRQKMSILNLKQHNMGQQTIGHTQRQFPAFFYPKGCLLFQDKLFEVSAVCVLFPCCTSVCSRCSTNKPNIEGDELHFSITSLLHGVTSLPLR